MKTVVGICLCALMLCVSALPAAAQVSAATKAEARDTLNRGVQAFRASDPRSAVDYFARALQLDPDLTPAELYLAAAYGSMYVPRVDTPENREYATKAIETYQGLLRKESGNLDAVTGLAAIYQNTSDFPRARETYLRMTRLSPQSATAFYSVGAIDWILVYGSTNPLPTAEKVRLIDEGLDHLDIAMALNPEREDAMSYKNLLLREKAKLTPDPAESARLTAQADELFNRTLEMRRRAAQAGQPGGAINANVVVALAPPPPPPPPPPPSRAVARAVTAVRIGGDVAAANLVTKVAPEYPALAKAARVQDVVILQAVIDREGRVTDLQILRGHPLLNDAATAAVRQWRYSPILLNGQPMDVQTTITVNFSFQ